MSEMLVAQNQEFLTYLQSWVSQLRVLTLDQAFPNPERSAVVSQDIIKGFCTIGPLSSPRVNAVVEPITELMQRAWGHGVKHIILSQDTHEPDAKEFGAWPPHCVRGTEESEVVDAIRNLPFYDQMITVEKNSINTAVHAPLEKWTKQHPEVDTYVVVGDCTDLCVYQTAMFLRVEANALQLERRVIVPENAVQTYDRSIEDAQAQGGFPHPGDLLHQIFLYHMALNGIEVVGRIV